jgi:hypothetical protein
MTSYFHYKPAVVIGYFQTLMDASIVGGGGAPNAMDLKGRRRARHSTFGRTPATCK